MSNPFRRICIGAWILVAGVAIADDAQAPPGRPRRPRRGGRSPSPARPAQPERIRVRRRQAHQGRADARRQEAEVRGTVTHTLTPLHPFLTRSSSTAGRSSRSRASRVGPAKAALHVRAATATS